MGDFFNKDVALSSKSVEWETPQDFFNELDKEFGFTLDACATAENAKCPVYFTKETNALAQNWGDDSGSVVFMNPPYGRKIGAWIKKAYYESRKGVIVICLVPSRTDTLWWHDYCMRGEIRFVKGRLRFNDADPAPFASAVVIFQKETGENNA